MFDALQALDVTTLLLVSAVYHGIFALIWLLLADFWRMAPPVSRSVAASQFCSMLAIGFALPRLDLAPGLREPVENLAALAALALLVLALLHALRQGRFKRGVVWISAAAAAGIGLASLKGWSDLALMARLAGLAALSAWALWRLARLRGAPQPTWLTAFLALPLICLGLLNGVRLLALAVDPAWDAVWMSARSPRALLVLLEWLLTGLAALSLVILLVWRLLGRARNLLRRDDLTGTLNRRAFQAQVVEAQAHLLRGQRFAFVVADVDHFKQVNDSLGHAGGDAALRHCVRVWRSCLRDLDDIGRIGGEEFGVLLWGADLPTATAVAERMRQRLEASPLVWGDRQHVLTASFGVALPRSHDPEGETGMARADAQLYRAKAQGRNRVCVAQDMAGAA
jgi:diguanylate cyclase (GGDEF)-like protein